jgi:hypothetical protein
MQKMRQRTEQTAISNDYKLLLITSSCLIKK